MTEEVPAPKKRGRKPKDPNAEPKTTKATATKTKKTKAEAEASLAAAVEETMPDAVAYAEGKSDEKPKAKKAAAKTSDPKKVNTGVWSAQRHESREDMPIIKDRMKIEIMLNDKALGMTPSDPNALKYVAKEADEMDPYGDPETQNERTITIWPKAKFVDGNADGCFQLVNEAGCPMVDPEQCKQLPYIYDYQIRGMFKDACGLLSRAKGLNESSELKAYKKWIDGNIFVSPRKIAFNLPESYYDDNGVETATFVDGKLQTLARPLRTSGPSGERSAIAISEIVPPATTFKFEIVFTDPKLRAVIVEWLDYGLFRGIGQWRNSGIGTFMWRELDENWMPIVDATEEVATEEE